MLRRDHHVEGLTERIDRIMAAVFVPEEGARLTRLGEDLAPGFVYVGPDGVFDGPDGLSEAFASYRHEEWWHASLRRTSPVELHHGYFRFTWARVERGATAMEGWAFGSLDSAGMIHRVVVFEGLEVGRSTGGD